MTQHPHSRTAALTPDLRVQRTREALLTALMSLTSEQGYHAVTVDAIARRARINRATFYRHYTDKYELVLSVIQAHLGGLEAQVASQTAPPHPVSNLHAPPAGLVQFFESLAEHAAFYRVMLGRGGMPSFRDEVRCYIERLMLRHLEQKEVSADQPSLPRALCACVMAHSGLGTVMWWLEQEQPCSATTLAGWFMQLVMPGIREGLGWVTGSNVG